MIRSLATLVVLSVLTGCASAPRPVPVVPENCAVPTDRGETDGGYGGTGRAPAECETQPQSETEAAPEILVIRAFGRKTGIHFS